MTPEFLLKALDQFAATRTAAATLRAAFAADLNAAGPPPGRPWVAHLRSLDS